MYDTFMTFHERKCKVKKAKRITALLITLAMALTLTATTPLTAHAAEAKPDIPYDEPYHEPHNTPPTPNTVSVSVTAETFFSFTPNATGYWTFAASNINNSSPQFTVRNHYGHILGTRGQIITLHLVEGAPYVIHAGCWMMATGDSHGSFTMTVSVSDEFVMPVIHRPGPTVIPGEGGYFSGYDDIFYSFIPNTSGLWELLIVTEDYDLLYLSVTDWDNNDIVILFDAEPQFHGTVRLTAGVEYRIRGWVEWDTAYSIYIRPAEYFIPWFDWEWLFDALTEEGFVLDLENEKTAIAPYGGGFEVEMAASFTFTPDETGPWSFIAESDAADLFIILTDTYGSFFTWGDLWWNNLHLIKELTQGVEYVVYIAFYESDNVNITFIVEPYEEIDWDDWDWDWYDDIDDIWQYIRIPAAGGYTTVDINSSFLFSPAATGSWTINLTNMSWRGLSIRDYTSSFFVNERDTAAISIHLAAGNEYVIDTGDAGWGGTSILSISPTYQIRLSSTVYSAYRRVAQETEFTFTPNQTGYWVIYTFNRVGATDPYLWLLDAEGNVLAQDDDSGEGLNALIKIRLEAGTEYTIRAGYFAGSGDYMLAVRKAGSMTERELVVLEPPAL